MTVLLVEDERAVRVSLARYLQSVGYRVVQVLDVDQAIAVAKDNTFAAVVLDVGLPDPSRLGRSGLDVLAGICACTRARRPTVVVFTGYVLTPEQERFIRSHGASIIPKPADYRVLIDRLKVLHADPPAA